MPTQPVRTVQPGQGGNPENRIDLNSYRRDFFKVVVSTLLGLAGAAVLPQNAAEAATLRSPENGVLPYFQITGVPSEVKSTDPRLRRANEDPAAQTLKGDVVHENITGLGTEYFMAHPGTRSLTVCGVGADGKFSAEQFATDWKQINDRVATLIGPDTQHSFTTGQPESFGAIEGGFLMIPAAYMEVDITTKIGNVNLKLGGEENHSYMVIVKAKERDDSTPVDNNTQVTLKNYNPGFTTATRKGIGQFIDEKDVLDNVAAAQGQTCGADGCQKVTVVYIDANTGAYTVIQKAKPAATWKQYKTNIKN